MRVMPGENIACFLTLQDRHSLHINQYFIRNNHGKVVSLMGILEKIRDQVFVCAIYGSPIRIIYKLPRSAYPNAVAMLKRCRADTGEVTHARIYVGEEFSGSDCRAERQESIRHEIHHLRICEIDLQRNLSPIIDEATAITDEIHSPEMLQAYRSVAVNQSEVDEEAFVRVADAYAAGYEVQCSKELNDVLVNITAPRGNIALANLAGCVALVFTMMLWFLFG
ncbi:hypothetical protein [Paracoccus sp. (in: a-proteobacteria)]|uniref:hypothetical protein n=1 Tax=Paracoccus sp. TaxID=267 RepID=UPI00321FEE46